MSDLHCPRHGAVTNVFRADGRTFCGVIDGVPCGEECFDRERNDRQLARLHVRRAEESQRVKEYARRILKQ